MMQFAALLLFIMSGTISAHAAMHWQVVPHKVDMMHIREASQVFRLIDGEGASISLMRPDLSKAMIATNANGHVVIKPDGMEYFHVLIATRNKTDTTTTAIRYFHQFGRPAPVSPSVLVNTVKSDLEIIPDPLPREHWSYMADNSAQFIVRFKGQVLANRIVDLMTSNGTHLGQKTDADGRLILTLPDDFPVTHLGYMHNKPAEMVLDTSYAMNGHRYHTILSADYFVNPAHWQLLSGGMLVSGGGVLLGGLVGWRLRRKKMTVGKKTRRPS